MSVTLLLHTILVKPVKVEEQDEMIRRARELGIHVELDKREQKAVEHGHVVQVGPTAFKAFGREPDILKVGDKVSFAKYAGKEIKINGETLLILNDEDILCVIGEDNG